MRSRTLVSIVAAAAAVATLTACGDAGSDTGSGSGSDGSLPRIATVVSYPALPSGLELGLFDDAFGTDASGMEVEFVPTGAEGVAALAAGHTDVVIGGFDSAALLGAPNARVLAMSEASPETHALLVPTDSEVQGLEDLEGATIGGWSATLSPFLALMLSDAGLPADYVEYIQVPNDGGLAALTSGAIDAWYTFDPFYAQAELEGLARPILDGSDFFLNPIVIVTSEEYLAENADTLENFLTGYAEATDWVNANPTEAGAYMAEATGMTEDAAALTIERRHYELTVPTADDVAWMDSMGEVLVDAGTLPELPDLQTQIDTTIVQQVLESR